MAALGFRTKADLADTAGVARSTITRLFKRAEYRPDVDVMRRLARGLQVEHETLVAAIYGEATVLPAQEVHPLAAEVGRTLGPESSLSESEKALQELLIDLTLDATRRQPRARIVVEGPREQLVVTKIVVTNPGQDEVRDVSVVLDHDDPDPLAAKLTRLETAALTLNPSDLRRLNANIQTLIEWAMGRGGLPEPTEDQVAAIETMQRLTRDMKRQQEAHARGEVPAAAERRVER